MRAGSSVGRWAAALIASGLMLLAGPAASAFGDASVRFVHAIPGAGDVSLDASSGGVTEKVATGIGFGEIGAYASIPAGHVIFEVRGPRGKVIAAAEEDIDNNARYTVVGIG